MHIAGVEVSGKDGRTIVDLLLRIGRDADLALAHRIERGFSRQVPTLPLSDEERERLASILADPPASLVELRDALADEQG